MIPARATRRTVLAACLIPVVILLTVASGCGSASPKPASPHLPHVTVSLVGGPRSNEWTFTTASHGGGRGFSTLVVQYPDGYGRVWGGTLLENGAAGSTVFNYFKDMARGNYRYYVYAMPVGPKVKWYEVPVRDRVARNLIASGSFSIR